MKLYFCAVTTLLSLTLGACQPEKVKSLLSAKTETVTSAEQQHSVENALDWSGRYQGTLPCVDCAGIQTVLTLNLDKTYMLQEHSLDTHKKPNVVQGIFTFDSANPATIVLDGASNHRKFFIGEGFVTTQTEEGNEMDGPLKAHYRLNKRN